MPIYEYECQNCGSHFETIQSFSSAKTPICPTCESENVVRQMSHPAIHFKGSGWYITDSKKADHKSANGVSENGHSENGGEKSKESSTDESKVSTNGDAKATSEKAVSEKKTSEKKAE